MVNLGSRREEFRKEGSQLASDPHRVGVAVAVGVRGGVWLSPLTTTSPSMGFPTNIKSTFSGTLGSHRRFSDPDGLRLILYLTFPVKTHNLGNTSFNPYKL